MNECIYLPNIHYNNQRDIHKLYLAYSKDIHIKITIIIVVVIILYNYNSRDMIHIISFIDNEIT